MRTTHWTFVLLVLASTFSLSGVAADQVTSTQQADTKLEKIAETPDATKKEMKDCPMHQGKKECDHKKGEPCPMHKDKAHHGKSHEKCDHEHHS